jgi:hypothetical protein
MPDEQRIRRTALRARKLARGDPDRRIGGRCGDRRGRGDRGRHLDRGRWGTANRRFARRDGRDRAAARRPNPRAWIRGCVMRGARRTAACGAYHAVVRTSEPCRRLGHRRSQGDQREHEDDDAAHLPASVRARPCGSNDLQRLIRGKRVSTIRTLGVTSLPEHHLVLTPGAHQPGSLLVDFAKPRFCFT